MNITASIRDMNINYISMDDQRIKIEVNKSAYCNMLIREYESILYRISDILAENYDEDKYNTYDDVEDTEYEEFDYKDLYKLIDENKHVELTNLINEHKQSIVKILPYMIKYETNVETYKNKINNAQNKFYDLYLFIENNYKELKHNDSKIIACLRHLYNMTPQIDCLINEDRHYIYVDNHYDSYY